MVSLWQKIFGSEAKSNAKAKSRLHFVLVQDRTGLSSEEMATFRGELLEVIEKYFTIDSDAFNVSYKREGEETALVINSPVAVKRALKKEVVKERAKVKENKEAVSAAPAS